MSFGRRALVYGVAALVGFLFAVLLLPRGQQESSPAEDASASKAQERAVSSNRASVGEVVTEDGDEVLASDETPGEPKIGRGGNPKARAIAEALSTPAHELVGRTSPVWVQVRRVLPGEEELSGWHSEVDSMIESLRGAVRDTELDLQDLIESQLDLMNRMEREDLGDAVGVALEELAGRLAAAQPN